MRQEHYMTPGVLVSDEHAVPSGYVRAEFEVWAVDGCGRLGRANTPGSDLHGYQDSHTDLCWKAWQASRASVVVDLPKPIGSFSDDDPGRKALTQGYNSCLRDCSSTIKAAGITIKGAKP
jgi:hypothetical protein